ncbi:signal peptidase I [Blautia sp. MSJ-19]|uniref:signal peptidase I n=1 Tax=Blautia sp. MSJ-19 TaxID=2841517 RepID=UPI001C0F15A1|nr:signal peptidase I [Blautia sp. MSJ-19]MBU5480523.1 signal peptidase I [Blautia sp. MSJ-19]
MIKKFFLTLINIISVMIIAAAVVVLCLVVFTKQGEAPSLGGYTVFRITTGSMKPTYDVDTLIVVKKTDPAQIRVGDVISFYSADPALDGSVNTHRVIAVEQDGAGWNYTTQGDANNIPDQYGTDSNALIGKVVASSLALGKLARLVSNPLIFIPVILIPLAVILVSNMIRTIRLAGKIARDEEEAAVREAIREIQEKRQKEKTSDKE